MATPRHSSHESLSESLAPSPASRQASLRVKAYGRAARRFVAALLVVTGLLSFSYTGLSTYLATRLVARPHLDVDDTPLSRGLAYHDVTFPSREDHLQLRGWLIPGVLPDGRLTVNRALVVAHGADQNRTDPAAGLLDLSADLARHGFAVLAFDLRNHGDSPAAPFSLGYFEQRDVLGAVDFLRSAARPYPELGPTRIIGGWGVSLGAISLLLAAAREPAMRAIVSDSGYPDVAPILEREIPKAGGIPPLFTPGALLAAQALYGIDFYAIRPVDAVGRIAPRPLFFIQGDADTFNPPSNLGVLTRAAEAAAGAHVESWMVHGAGHAQAYHVAGQEYVTRVSDFFDAALGADASAG